MELRKAFARPLAILLPLFLTVAAPPALAAGTKACLQQPHRFEALSLRAPALERAKRLLV